MLPYRVAIAGCARDCAQYLPAVFANIDRLSSLFAHVEVVIAYDESRDETEACLLQKVQEQEQEQEQEQKQEQKRSLTLLPQTGPLSPVRTQRISAARNRILMHFRKRERMDPSQTLDYLLMMDLDDVCAAPMHVDRLLPLFPGVQEQQQQQQQQEQEQWDALSFHRSDYYDIWALSVFPFVISCWNFGEYHKSLSVVHTMRRHILSILDARSSLLPVESAFNGFGIYRWPAFRDCWYDWTTLDMHLIPNETMKANIEAVGGWKPQYRPYADDCEHRAFHRQAIAKHGARIRIAPVKLFE